MARKEPRSLLDLALKEAEAQEDWRAMNEIRAIGQKLEQEEIEEAEERALVVTVCLWGAILAGAVFLFFRVAG